MKMRAWIAAIGFSFFVLPVAQASQTQLTVFAASSLSQTFTSLGKAYEAAHPNVKILFSFQSSSTLAAQIAAGAPADLFASASMSDMAKVKILIPEPIDFVSNRIVLSVPKSSKISINKLVDLNRAGVKWIQCTLSAPCGAVTDAALRAFGKVSSHPVSYEANASSVVAKLLNGEVDAAFIYHTDFVSHSKVLKEIRFADAPSTTTRYSIGAMKDGKNVGSAQDFVQFILSPKGIVTLTRAGFTKIQR